MSEQTEREWLTLEQVANRLQVHVETVRRWVREGELPVLDLGKRAGYRVQPADLDAYIAARFGPVGKSVA
jgi:excisionase family DNA binding protein